MEIKGAFLGQIFCFQCNLLFFVCKIFYLSYSSLVPVVEVFAYTNKYCIMTVSSTDTMIVSTPLFCTVLCALF
jgi:hypothetical protein